MADFRVIGEITAVETIAEGKSIREVHWYEAHGVGSVELKIKRYVE